MKVYPDANIYITYLLGQKGEALTNRFFKQGLSCRFSIVASNTMFAEVAQRCKDEGNVLLQKNIDDFKKAGKLEMVEPSEEDDEMADSLDLKSGKKYGLNDFTHALLARRYADIFVTNDEKFAPAASKLVRTETLRRFVASKPEPL